MHQNLLHIDGVKVQIFQIFSASGDRLPNCVRVSGLRASDKGQHEGNDEEKDLRDVHVKGHAFQHLVHSHTIVVGATRQEGKLHQGPGDVSDRCH